MLQFGYGYAPCKLCLTERLPYYAAVPLGAPGAVRCRSGWRASPSASRRLGLLYGAGLGVYHAGAEWGFWPGPTDCGGGTGANPAAVGDFLNALADDEGGRLLDGGLRVLGISLAGWNAVVACVLASVAGTAAARP